MSLNIVTIMGRMTADPELKHTPNNVAVATFTLAVDRDFKDKDGERRADFIRVVCWRNTAEFVSRYFAKGRMAVVNGRLQVRDYTDNNNVRHYVSEVVADNVYFGDSKREAVVMQDITDNEDMSQIFPAQSEGDLPF